MNWFKKLLTPAILMAKYPIESYIRLETADDEVTLVADDGSLVTVFRVDGSRQIIGEEEYRHIIENATIKMGSRFDRPGYALQVYFSRNPDQIKNEIGRFVYPNKQAARNIGLEVEDLFEEKERHLSHFLSWEEIYFVLWTRPSALSPTDLERAKKENSNQKWVPAQDSQYPFMAFDVLRGRHKSYISSIGSVLGELGVQAKIMTTHDALRAVRTSLFPETANENWRACLPGDKMRSRAPLDSFDYSDILWPSLKSQISASNAETINRSIVRIGNQLWGGCDMTLGPTDPSPFPVLLNRLVDTKTPFRISFLIESGGIQGAQMRKFVASILGVTNATNKQIKSSLDNLIDMARSEPIVKMRINAATWAPDGEIELARERLSSLVQSMESWGYAQVSNMVGDPLDCVMSSALGISCASTAPAAIVPLSEVVKLLPWQRASSPFETGAVILRTPDGRIWPYQPGSNLTTTWFDFIFAQPGAGKSVLMNSLNLGTCFSAGSSQLPYLAIIDIGPSSSGLVSLMKDALPKERQHEVAHYKLRMTPDYAVNPFDTQLGSRYPLPDERSYLIELITLLCTPPGQQQPYDGIPQLAGLVVDEMFRWRDDAQANSESRPYLPRLDNAVDQALMDFNLHLPPDATWWDVVDILFKQECYHEAALAQRHAVPILADAVTAARRPQIRDLLEETQIGLSAENVIHAFERMITSAVREFPILSSVTKFDLSGTKICALDLQDVCPQGDETADRQTAIMYMLARHTLVRSWWLGEDSLKNFKDGYRTFHELRLRDIKESPKRLCYDEFHRTSKSRSVRSQIVRDVREGRKWGVQIVLASQLLEDFDDDMVDLATGVWILGAAVSDRAVDAAQKRFGLSDTARWIMRHRLTGPRSSGAPALLVLGTNEGRYEQHLINTLGPIELWALSTSAEDVSVRTRLYKVLGASEARRLLAAAFPGGSARSENRRRVDLRSKTGEIESAATSAVIENIVEELIETAQSRRLRTAGFKE